MVRNQLVHVHPHRVQPSHLCLWTCEHLFKHKIEANVRQMGWQITLFPTVNCDLAVGSETHRHLLSFWSSFLTPTAAITIEMKKVTTFLCDFQKTFIFFLKLLVSRKTKPHIWGQAVDQGTQLRLLCWLDGIETVCPYWMCVYKKLVFELVCSAQSWLVIILSFG